MNMMSEFSKVCVSFAEGMELYNKTMKVYDFLNNHKGEKFSPTEIAESLGYGWHLNDDKKKYVFKDKVVKPLHWLLEMELIKRDSYTATLVFPEYGCEGHYERDVKIIDGIVYTGRIWVEGEYKKEVTMYEWYVE